MLVFARLVFQRWAVMVCLTGLTWKRRPGLPASIVVGRHHRFRRLRLLHRRKHPPGHDRGCYLKDPVLTSVAILAKKLWSGMKVEGRMGCDEASLERLETGNHRRLGN